MSRGMTVLLSLIVVLLAAPALDASGNIAVLSAPIAALLVSALVLRGGHGHLVLPRVATVAGPAADERCLRGSFRRQSSPDAPGRPQRPRAPGDGPRPA